jgi:hypothetical protein
MSRRDLVIENTALEAASSVLHLKIHAVGDAEQGVPF